MLNLVSETKNKYEPQIMIPVCLSDFQSTFLLLMNYKPVRGGILLIFGLNLLLACLKIQDYGSAGRMDTNDSLRVASLWHSMHAISQQLSPISGCSGTELLEADTFDLHCFQSLTGTFFLPLLCLICASNAWILSQRHAIKFLM